MNQKLNKEEKQILRDRRKGLYKPLPKKQMLSEIKEMEASAKVHIKDKMVSFRVSGLDIYSFKQKAAEVGVPYQTLITAFIKQYPKGKATLTI